MDVRHNLARALKVLPNDNVDIPDFPRVVSSGATTATTASKLVDSAANFTAGNTEIGSIIYNKSTGALATVTAIDSTTTLSVSDNVFVSGNDYSIHPVSGIKGVNFYVGVAGDVSVVTYGGDDSVVVAAANGWHPLQIKRIKATGTAATDFLVGF